MNKEFIDSCLNEFQGNFAEEKTIDVLSVPMPSSYKDKYKELQNMTDKKFGKLLQKIIKHSIDEFAKKV